MTTDVAFDYTVVSPPEDASRPSSLIVSLEAVDQPLQAVIWSVRHHAWVYAPGPAARILYDDQQFDRLKEIDRRTAEQVARDFLGAELPGEDELLRICEQGNGSGQTYGPPLS